MFYNLVSSAPQVLSKLLSVGIFQTPTWKIKRNSSQSLTIFDLNVRCHSQSEADSLSQVCFSLKLCPAPLLSQFVVSSLANHPSSKHWHLTIPLCIIGIVKPQAPQQET